MLIEMTDVLGTREVAALLNLRHETVLQYHARGQMPTPTMMVSNKPLWSLQQIEDWEGSRKKIVKNRGERPVHRKWKRG